jgi:effector-binding domain-containing protein
LQRALYAIVALFVLIVIGGFAAPRFVRVEVSTLVDAPASVVFAQANDFRRLALWAPPNAADPDARVRYSGPERGRDAFVSWQGPAAGSGSQRIVESIPYEYVSFLVNPGEPGEAAAWIDVEAAPGGTRVTRGFEHDYGYNIVGRYFGLLWAGMIRRDYSASLTRLADLVESLPRADYADIEVVEEFVEATDIAYAVATVAGGTDAASRSLGDAYVKVLGFIESRGLAESGPPLAILRGSVGTRRRLDAAVPITGDTSLVKPGRDVRLGRTYEGHVASAVHRGSYDKLAATHQKLKSYLAATGRKPNGDPWEVYVTDPGRTPEAALETRVVYPVLIY